MRLRVLAAVAALSFSSSLAFADAGTAGVGAKAASGLIVAGGAAGTVALVTNLFGSGNKREALAVSKAPEISTSGTVAGLILLAGGALVLRGRQRSQDLAQ